ncbi:MAG: WD40 repeat domain-containing serine/threonine protein kinase [Planctomycetota bacterium]
MDTEDEDLALPSRPDDESSIEGVWAETIQLAGAAGADFTHTFQPLAPPSAGAGSGLALPSMTLDGDATRETLFEPPPSSCAGQPSSGSSGDLGAHDETMIEGELATRDLPPEALPQPAAAPVYSIQEVIGRGGMGVVYRARQGSLQRDVALKRLRRKRDDEGSRRRFLAEAVVNGRLDHPNVVPVYDLGFAPDGEAVLAMKLVDGVPWSKLLHPRTPEDQDRARDFGLEGHLDVLIQVSNAVAFAHSRGLIHNDLKPPNVMLGEFGEVLVMDWGLAVDIDAAPDPDSPIPHKTSLRHPCGTPAYMPPELAEGRGEDLGPWTDVYLLGAILFEVLDGKPPHHAETIKGVLTRALKSDPPRFGPEVPEELATICRRAMAKEPSERYASALELRDALQGFLKHRESLVVTDAASALLARCGAGAPDQARMGQERMGQERSQLYTDLGEAIAGFGQALVLWGENEAAARGRRAARLAYARAALEGGDLGLAEAQLARLEEGDAEGQALRTEVEAARAELERAARAARALRLGLGAALGTIVVGLGVGLLLISAEQRRTAEQADRARRAQEVAEAEREAAQRARVDAERARVEAERRYADGLVAHAHALGSTSRWSEARARYREARALYAKLARPTTPAELGLLEAAGASPEPLFELAGHTGEARAAAFLTDGRLATCGADGALRLWDAQAGCPDPTRPLLAQGLGPLRDLCVSPVGSWVAVAGDAGVLHLVPLDGGPARELRGHKGPILAVDADYEGLTLISAGEDGTVRLWDAATGKEQVQLPHTAPVESAFLTPSPRYAFSADRAGRLVWWNRSGSVHWDYTGRGRLSPPAEPLRAMVHSPEGTGSRISFAVGREAQVWAFNKKLNNFIPYHRLEGHRAPVTGLAYAPVGDRLLSVGLDARLLEWKLETPVEADDKELPTRPTPVRELSLPGPALAVAVSPSGDRVAVTGRDGRVRLWDLGLGDLQRSGAERRRVPLRFEVPSDPLSEQPRRGPTPQPARLSAAALGPDGLLAAAGAADGGLTLWSAPLGRRLEELRWHTKGVLATGFLDARRLVSVGREGWVRVWDVGTLTPLSTVALGGPDGADEVLSAAALSPDGAQAIVALLDGSTRRLDLASGAELGRGPAGPRVSALALGADAELAAVGRADGSVELRASQGRAKTLNAQGRPVTALALLRRELVAADDDGQLTLWDRSSGERLAQRRGHRDAISALRVLPGGRELLSAGADGTWRVWSLPGLEEARSFTSTLGPLGALATDPAGEQVLVAGGAELERWDLGLARRAEAARAAAAASPDAVPAWLALQGSLRSALTLLPAAAEGEAALLRAHTAWELGLRDTALAALARARGAASPVYLERCAVALRREQDIEGTLLGRTRMRVRGLVVADGRVLSASQYGLVEERDAATGALLRTLLRHPDDISTFELSPDGRLLALGDTRGSFGVWERASGRRLHLCAPPKSGGVTELRFHPDGERLVVATWDRQVRFFAVQDGRELGLIGRLDRRQGEDLAASPDGRWVAAADSGGELFLFDASGAEAPRRWQPEPRGSVRGLVFTAPDRLLGWCDRAKTLRVWSLQGEQLAESTPGDSGVYAVALDLARKRVVTGTSAFRAPAHVTVWDLETLRPTASWLHDETILRAALTPDAVLLGCGDGRILRRPLPPARK